MTKVWRIFGVKKGRHASSYLRHNFVVLLQQPVYFCSRMKHANSACSYSCHLMANSSLHFILFDAAVHFHGCMYHTRIHLLIGARPTVYWLVTTIYESISTCSISLHNYHCFFNSITKVWRICGVKGVRHTSSYLRHTFVIPSLYYCKSQCNSTVEWTILTVLAHTVAIWWPTVPFTSSSLLLLSIFVHSSYSYLPFIMHETNVYC